MENVWISTRLELHIDSRKFASGYLPFADPTHESSDLQRGLGRLRPVDRQLGMDSWNGFPEKDPWHPWTFDDLDDTGVQVGGYAVNYKVPPGSHNFTFITVRGGRHEVPETAPKLAFSMFSRLIAGETF